ncbi:MAG: hypothetical protein ACJ8EN_00465, partial [Xanthobacteraceae bacterium]
SSVKIRQARTHKHLTAWAENGANCCLEELDAPVIFHADTSQSYEVTPHTDPSSVFKWRKCASSFQRIPGTNEQI